MPRTAAWLHGALSASDSADGGLLSTVTEVSPPIATSTDASPSIPSRCSLSGKSNSSGYVTDTRFAYFPKYRSIMSTTLYSRRLPMSHESQPSASFVSGVGKLCPRPRAIADDESRITAEHIICFRGTQTVPVAARNERHHHNERIVTQIFRDMSRSGARTGQWSVNSTVPRLFFFTCPGTSGPA